MLEVFKHQITPSYSAGVFWIYRVDCLHIPNWSDLTADTAL